MTRLRHMRDAAAEAVRFAQGKTRAGLDEDRQLVLALVKCIEIVGEAAAGVSAALRERHPVAGHRRHAEPPYSRVLRG
jgi:uncharacterized protein with HEPN domain